jgi:hypothetical protein
LPLVRLRSFDGEALDREAFKSDEQFVHCGKCLSVGDEEPLDRAISTNPAD